MGVYWPRRISFSFVALLLLASRSPHAQADLAKGKKNLAQGNYALAKSELKETKGANKDLARLELARLALLEGNYAEAVAIAKELHKQPNALGLEAGCVLAEALSETGKYREAKTLLIAQVKKDPSHYPTRHALGLAHQNLGEDAEARALWNQVFDDYAKGTLDENDARTQYFIAEAARYLGSVQDASDAYQSAFEIDKNLHKANLDWGYLFLSKYNPAQAEQSFSDILKINPKHPKALVGLAQVELSASYNLAKAKELADKALKVNPKSADAFVVKAAITLDHNDWRETKKLLAKALKSNPEHTDARAMLATVHWLRDDEAGFEREKKRVLAMNPKNSRFFHVVMRSAEREHRYHRGVELGKEAVRINPRDHEAMQLVGSGLLRLGQEKEGVEWLQKAYYGDQYNLRTINTLKLFEEIIPRQYVWRDSKNFRVRYHKDEADVYHRHITPTLEKAYAGMVKRYGFTPKGPLHVEIFPEAEHYATRTIGLASLAALGVCFGQVITAKSPSVGELNWSMVLWHELSHVFAIQLSNYRVPRWFTEGLSEYETIRERPEWRRENDSDLWLALQSNTLPSVSELNHAFMKTDMQSVVVAYHLSSVTIEYIVATYGFPPIVEALKLFGKGKETPEVIETITGKKVATFDREFRSHLRKRLAPFHNSLVLPKTSPEELKLLLKKSEKSTLLADESARLALGFLYAGDAAKASQFASASLATKANAVAHYILGELAIKARDTKNAKKHYGDLLRMGTRSFDVRVRLAMIAKKEKREADFVRHLQSAKASDLEKGFPFESLAEYYFEKGERKKALQELEGYIMIEHMSLPPVLRLVEEHEKDKNWNKVVRLSAMALRIDPMQGKLLLSRGSAQLQVGDANGALESYDTALELVPPLRRPALAYLGRAKALSALGKKTLAQKALKDCLLVEPELLEALQLQKKL